MAERHIVAIGGRRLGAEPADLLLEKFIGRLARRPRPKVCFIPTASGDSDSYIVNFYRTFSALSCQPSHLALFWRTALDLRAYLLDQDVIYVGGGNTANMLAVWRIHGLDKALRQAWRAGTILCGSSAGSICWFECGVTDSFGASKLRPLYDGLGFLPGSNCPHYDSEPKRRPTYRRLIAQGFPAGLATEDGVALHFVGSRLKEVVSARRGARAFRVERARSRVVETPLPVRYLGKVAGLG